MDRDGQPTPARPPLAVVLLALLAAGVLFVLAPGEWDRDVVSVDLDGIDAPAPPIVTPRVVTPETDGQALPVPETGVPGWSEVPAGPLAPRTAHTAIWTGDELLVWGGFAPGTGHADGASYSVSAEKWRRLPMAPVDGAAASAWTGERFFVFTGASAMFDLGDERWRPLAYPSSFSSHPLAAAWTGEEIVVVGYRLHPPTSADNLFAAAYGPAGECCRPVPDPPIDLSHGRAIWTGTELVLIGGFDDGSGVAVTAMASYDPAGNAWTVLDPPPVAGVAGMAVAWTGRELVTVDADLNAATWTAATGWRRTGSVPFDDAGCFPRVAAIDSQVFAWYCRQAAGYDTTTGRWQRMRVPALDDHAVSTSCLPVAGAVHVLLWCGNGDGKQPFFWVVDLGATEPVITVLPGHVGVWKTSLSPPAAAQTTRRVVLPTL